ncbi:MAG: hypothetical protein KCHDKBKB_01991 [Elusimicrobia bacterium]|nr:hypothetical protein [Elusimicrobiota bacterium]
MMERLIHQAQEKNLSKHPQWRALLHFRSQYFGKDQSDIDGPNFFLSSQGKTDAQAELEATLGSFFEPIPQDLEKQHPRCKYPARYAWLNEQLNLDSSLPPLVCERFQSWRKKLNPGSLSLVFSSYYLNNPASMYGHTFLRVGKKNDQESGDIVATPLLDYTVNFAARTNTKNGIAFAVRGLMGGYPGDFTSLPYYMKVQQYNNLESRDLWEYTLNISTDGVERLVAHLWEMGPTTIAYYFLNKNCSYQLLPMLEVADPTLRLSSSFRFRAIPVDTLNKVMDQKGLVTGVVYRPSALQKMIAARDRLSSDEKKLAWNLATQNSESDALVLKKFSVDRKKMILAAAYDLLRYRSGYYRNQPTEVQEREHRLLLLLNSLPPDISMVPPAIPKPTAPHEGHKTGRVGLALGLDRETAFQEIVLRGALHNLEEDPKGYVNGSQLEMLSARVRYENDSSHLFVEEALGIHVKSLAPWEAWVHKPSWQFKIQYARARDLDENVLGSGFAGVAGGSGVTFRFPWIQESLVYGLIEMDGSIGSVFRDGYRLGLGPLVGWVGAITRQWRFHVLAGSMRYGVGNISSANKLQMVQSFQLKKDLELRGVYERVNHHREGRVVLQQGF